MLLEFVSFLDEHQKFVIGKKSLQNYNKRMN